jgi:hypothetical protein
MSTVYLEITLHQVEPSTVKQDRSLERINHTKDFKGLTFFV